MFKIPDTNRTEELLRKLDLKESYSDLVIKLIEEAVHKSKAFKESYRLLKKEILNILDDVVKGGLIKVCNIEPKIFEDVSLRATGATDGSFVFAKSFGSKYIALISASSIVFKNGLKSSSDPQIKVGIKILNESYSDIMEAKREVVKSMMIFEVKSLIETSNKIKGGFIFIDGPLIDPPNLLDEDYIKERVAALIFSIARRNTVIGYVKRFESDIFSNNIKRTLNVDLDMSDRDLIPLMFNIYREKYKIPPNEPIATNYFKSREADEKAIRDDVFKEYKSRLSQYKGSYEIFAFYFQPRYATRPIKVEFIIDVKNMEPDRIYRNIIHSLVLWSWEGLDIALPVQLAHKTSLIRKNVATLIINEILTKLAGLFEDYVDIITINDLISIGE
ncbi:MAG: DNA double-strand break repair nuclease NurA [Candidatus Njordarchaeia archaeon]